MIFTRVEQVRDEILFLSTSVAECLPGMHETLSSIPSTEKRREDGEVSISQRNHALFKAAIIFSGQVVHLCNHNTQ